MRWFSVSSKISEARKKTPASSIYHRIITESTGLGRAWHPGALCKPASSLRGTDVVGGTQQENVPEGGRAGGQTPAGGRPLAVLAHLAPSSPLCPASLSCLSSPRPSLSSLVLLEVTFPASSVEAQSLLLVPDCLILRWAGRLWTEQTPRTSRSLGLPRGQGMENAAVRRFKFRSETGLWSLAPRRGAPP